MPERLVGLAPDRAREEPADGQADAAPPTALKTNSSSASPNENAPSVIATSATRKATSAVASLIIDSPSTSIRIRAGAPRRENVAWAETGIGRPDDRAEHERRLPAHPGHDRVGDHGDRRPSWRARARPPAAPAAAPRPTAPAARSTSRPRAAAAAGRSGRRRPARARRRAARARGRSPARRRRARPGTARGPARPARTRSIARAAGGAGTRCRPRRARDSRICARVPSR